MASVRGVSAATLASGGLAMGAYGYSQFDQGGLSDKGKGILAGAGALGLEVGALKIALGGMGREGGRKFAGGVASGLSRKGAARMKLGGGIGAAAVGLGIKAGYDFKQGEIQSGMAYGAGAGVAAYAGMSSFRSGMRASSAGRGITKAIKTAGKEAARSSRMIKLGAGLGAGAVGLGVKAYNDFQEGDITEGLKYGAGSAAVGFLAKSSFSSGFNSKAKSRAIDKALDASEKFARRAGRYKSFGRAGLVGAGIGVAVAGAGINSGDMGTTATGVGIAGAGALAAYGGYKGYGRSLDRAAGSISRATKLAKTSRKAIAEGGRSAASGGRALVRAADVAESVTRLRPASNVPKGALGLIGAAGITAGYMAHQLGIF